MIAAGHSCCPRSCVAVEAHVRGAHEVGWPDAGALGDGSAVNRVDTSHVDEIMAVLRYSAGLVSSPPRGMDGEGKKLLLKLGMMLDNEGCHQPLLSQSTHVLWAENMFLKRDTIGRGGGAQTRHEPI